MAVNCAILSYNGTVYFGFSGDVHAAPDLKRMEKLLQASFIELREAVDLRPPQTQLRKKRRTVPAAAVSREAQPQSVRVTGTPSAVQPKREPESASASVPENALEQVVVA